MDFKLSDTSQLLCEQLFKTVKASAHFQETVLWRQSLFVLLVAAMPRWSTNYSERESASEPSASKAARVSTVSRVRYGTQNRDNQCVYRRLVDCV